MTNQTCWIILAKTRFTRLLSAAFLPILLTGCVALTPFAESAPPSDGNMAASQTESAAPTLAGEDALDSIAQKDIPEIDQKLLQRMANLTEIFRLHADSIWTEAYRFDELPILIVYKDSAQQAQHGYLFNHPNGATLPTAQLVEMDTDLALSPVYRLAELPSERVKQVRHFDFQVPIAGASAFVMAYSDPSVDPFAAPVSADWDAFIVHEALHHYQHGNWAQSVQMQNIDGYPLDGDAIANIQLEHKLLIAALSATDDASRDMALKQFIAVRSDRLEQNSIVQHMDLEQERFEGTARYIEYQLAQHLPNPGQISAERYLDFSLAADAGRDELAFGRFYSTGAALSLLLDQVGIPWKSAIEQGDSQFDVLSEHYGLADSAAEKSALLNAARETYEYATMQQAAAKTAETVDDNFVGFDLDQSFDGDNLPPSDGEVIESIEKPYEPVDVLPLTTSLPAGYTLQGGFEASFEELGHEIFQLEYSPGQESVSVVDYDSAGERLRLTQSRFDGTVSDVKAMEADLVFSIGRQRSEVNGVEALLFSMDDPVYGLHSTIGFAHDGNWYSVAGAITVEQVMEIAAEIIYK